MTGAGPISPAPTGRSGAETEAALLGLDERAIRLECLKLASDQGPGVDLIGAAEKMAAFVLQGNAE